MTRRPPTRKPCAFAEAMEHLKTDPLTSGRNERSGEQRASAFWRRRHLGDHPRASPGEEDGRRRPHAWVSERADGSLRPRQGGQGGVGERAAAQVYRQEMLAQVREAAALDEMAAGHCFLVRRG